MQDRLLEQIRLEEEELTPLQSSSGQLSVDLAEYREDQGEPND